jgi:hypothetical protein
MDSHRVRMALLTLGIFGANLMAPRELRAQERASERTQQQAQTPPSAGLVGLDGVLVAVDLPTETAALLRIDRTTVADRVDRELRAARIRNLSRESPTRQGAAELRITLRAARLSDPALVAYQLAITVWEPAQLVRDRTKTVLAATWQSPGVLAADKPPVVDTALQQVDEQLDVFVRAFRAANARR